jgi:hypothetical protein
MTCGIRQSRTAAILAGFGLLVQTVAPAGLLAAQSGTKPTTPAVQPPETRTAKPAQPTPATTTTKPAQPTPAASTAKPGTNGTTIDGGWPRVYDVGSGGSMLVYQPQIASWDKQKNLMAYSAVSYRAKAADKPAIGTIKMTADTSVSTEERLVSFRNMKIEEVNFQTLQKEQVQELTGVLTKVLSPDERIIALDRVLANLDKSQVIPKNVEGIKADPPSIFFSKTPAVMVNLDGEAIWSPIKDNDLKYAVNTNWDLFEHTPTKTFYLRNNDTWLKTTDVVKGPWSPAGKLPGSFSKLPAEDNWKDVKAALPGKAVNASAVPKIFVSTTPAELILLTGEPSYLLVEGTKNLLWVSNTESDVFRTGKTGLVYYLVAGRWFSAPDFTGPWTFATPNLPEEFKQIPMEHQRSRVLASVPGTDQAAEAVLVAQIPQTARVNKKEIKAPDVAFQGDPQFQSIEKTTVERAVNTDKDVFKINNLFYMCYQGVWFVGKTATGPWEVAESVPEQIYQIPVSSPAHHVTYVTVEEDNDDDWVVFAAAAGYTGMMVAWGCTVWGSGWYYPPYWGYGAYYPYYYPHFPTYGYSAWYNPHTGAYGRSASVYGPYGGAGVGARYNPRTGTYARGAAAYGPYGARGVAQAYNPRTGTYAQTRQGSNVYGSWGSTSVQRGDDWAKTNRYTNNRTGNTTRTVRTDEGNAVMRKGDNGRIAAGSGGDIYAGHDGNAYRRQDGTWQKYDNGSWSNTDRQPQDRPTPNSSGQRPTTTDRGTMDQLNRDSAARREGTQRSGSTGSYRSTPQPRSSGGSYRGGGGMSRGGGGRRR